MNSLVVKKTSAFVFGVIKNTWSYFASNVLKAEEIFTLIFLTMFVCFLYLYGNKVYPSDNQRYSDESGLSKETLKLLMWMSAFMAAISHLMPKKEASKGKTDSVPIRNFGKINEKLRESLMTAIKIDEQKRLEYIKQKPPLLGRSQSSNQMIGKQTSKFNEKWQPILKRESTIEKVRPQYDESFNLFYNERGGIGRPRRPVDDYSQSQLLRRGGYPRPETLDLKRIHMRI